MAGIVKGAAGLVGNTPLLEPVNLEKKEGLKARILLKLEYFNPAGSVKDRVGKAMIEDAEARGVLKPGSVKQMSWQKKSRTALSQASL